MRSGGGIALPNRARVALRRPEAAMAPEVATAAGIACVREAMPGARINFGTAARRFKCLALFRERRMTLHAGGGTSRIVGEQLADESW